MFRLKTYQDKALETVDAFFRRLRVAGRDLAWQELAPVQQDSEGRSWQTPYDDAALEGVPAICVRIPTGGGKTLLAAHVVARVGKSFCDTDAPVALWLVPSDAIRSQTLIDLQTPRQPGRMALEQYFGDQVRVCGLDSLATVGRHEVGNSAIVIVATIQSFNVKDKSIRNVFAFDESFAPHFQGLTPQQMVPLDKVSEADVAAQPFLTHADLGRVKTSLANWLAMYRPIVVVDEAHNNRTEQAYRTLKDLNPACVVEMTATPAKGSNVLYHVGAQALQREEMIKLPIVLMEHPTGWKDAVRDARLTRDRLEILAASDHDYIRPMLLFQAQPKGGEVTVDVLEAHLSAPDGEKLDPKQIAVATGERKELDAWNLADPACPIRYVITVEALKEGWNCPFAYVLCSFQDAHSAKDVEQLLGRVLRMPYARSRDQPELNKAYAHIAAPSFVRVADQLADRLVKNMGFDDFEAAQAIVPAQAVLPMPGGEAVEPLTPVEAVISLPAMPKKSVPADLRECIELRATSQGATAIIRGELSEAVENFLLSSCTVRQQPAVKESIEKERARQEALLAPSARGVVFAAMPQLCLDWDGALQPVERRLLCELGVFDLFNETISLAGFAIREVGTAWEIDVEGGKIRYEFADAGQLHLNEVASHASENDLVRWLDRECRQVDVAQATLIKWLTALSRHLMADRGYSLTALLRAKYQLAEASRREIERRRKTAIKRGFQSSLHNFVAAPSLADGFRYEFTFHADRYPSKPPFYSGRYRFKKHYYGGNRIHDLRERTDKGRMAEEFLCAQAIDMNPHVKHWVRNVAGDDRFSFWLPTDTDYFYPDFVCELTDKRVMAVEYKGDLYITTDDSREKSQVGHQWEATSGGKCLFLMAVKDDQGRGVAQQIADAIERHVIAAKP